ncbi:MAG: metal-dependent transcriptional regulator [Spirochaetaceae bacterium]|nr:MAG: metal-dependent transcriptional regulator [Spirochaetaceae bacterium]
MAEEYSESIEMYLKTILALTNDSEQVHSVDVARKMDVSKPSVNRALRVLKDDGLINHERYGSITFTRKGRHLAEEVQGRYDTIVAFLVKTLKLDPVIAHRDACRMEHILSPETYEAIQGLITEK